MSDNTARCPGCPGRRAYHQYLCNPCWSALPAITRGLLALRDSRAHLRLRQLHTALADNTPLAIIRVSR